MLLKLVIISLGQELNVSFRDYPVWRNKMLVTLSSGRVRWKSDLKSLGIILNSCSITKALRNPLS